MRKFLEKIGKKLCKDYLQTVNAESENLKMILVIFPRNFRIIGDRKIRKQIQLYF